MKEINGITYKNGKIITQESIPVELDYDSSEGQDWNWKDYEWLFGRHFVSNALAEIKAQLTAWGERAIANALKGKTHTTWTIILPNEDVAKEFM